MRTQLLFCSFFLSLFWGVTHGAFAQAEFAASAPSVQANVSVGRIFKHTTNFRPPIRGTTVLTELSYELQTAGAKAWHTTFNYPIIGVSLLHADFGDPEIFGQAIGIFPSLTLSNRASGKRFYRFFRAGFGVAYLTKPHNALTNATNNIIGSHWNNITDLRGGFGYRLAANWDVMAGANFTHYSDGSSQLPNLGINVPSPFIAVRFTPVPLQKYTEHKDGLPENPWHGLFGISYGIQEFVALGGPKYALLLGSAGAMYDLDKKHHLFAIAEYEFNEGIYKWAKNQNPVELDDERLFVNRASRYALAIGDEFHFGQFAFSTSFGFYLPSVEPTPLFMYEKIGWRYYFLPKQRVQPYLNIHLKAHLITAEYFSFGGGVRF